MIPKRIHYCWFGKSEMPELALKCIDSWHRYLPDYEFKLWNEDNSAIDSNRYAIEAYETRKYAFVSDYIRLWALEKEGGIYLDTDVEVFKSFDDLLDHKAFAGFEGSKYKPLGTCIMASMAHGEWVSEMLDAYSGRCFIKSDGSYDLTTNVRFITQIMKEGGFIQNGEEQIYKDLHIFPVDFFSPRLTTGEYFRTENTYCDHHGLGSWGNKDVSWKTRILSKMTPALRVSVIKIKRLFFG